MPRRRGRDASTGPPDEARALEWSLRYLEFRPRSEAEVARYLRRKGVDAELAERTVKRLRQTGLLDDARFARQWVETRSELFRLGKLRLRRELLQKRVERDLIDEATEALDEEVEFQRALALAERQLRRLAGLDGPDQLRRLAGYLSRRGFAAPIVWRSVREALRAAEAELPEGLSSLEEPPTDEAGEDDGSF